MRTLDRGPTTAYRAPGGRASVHTINEAAELELMWGQHQTGNVPPLASPQIDFSQERVVAAFLGEKPTEGYAIEMLGAVELASGQIEIAYTVTSPNPAGPPSAPSLTSPYHIVAIDRTQGDVLFRLETPSAATPPSAPPPPATPTLIVNDSSFTFAVQGPHTAASAMASGGSGTNTWSTVAGSLPSGLGFTNGEVSGSAAAPGTYFLNVMAQDTSGNTATGTLAVTTVPLRIETIAGNGTRGSVGDGGLATAAQLNVPGAAVEDANGNLFILDSVNHRVRRVDAATGIIQTVAGNGTPGFSGDGGPALAAQINAPQDLILDPNGNLLIAERNNHRIRKVDMATGIITTVAGNGAPGFSGDGGPALAAQLNQPLRIAADNLGNIFIADYANHRIRRVDYLTNVITTVAGNGAGGFQGDGGLAAASAVNFPRAIAFDAAETLFVLHGGGGQCRIRRVDSTTGVITTYAGGPRGFGGDGGPAIAANINAEDFEIDRGGNMFVADYSNHRLRRIDAASGVVTTIAGNGQGPSLGDGGPAAVARVINPVGLSINAKGQLYVCEANAGSNRVRRLGP